ncbi:ATP-binding protein [Clostridium botulinum]|uniref:ATP-binding protein n=1 Tax=Clostridium botulinum TaxID=1491 RepID=UPI0019674E5F
MKEYIPIVKETSLYREIAKKLVNSLEFPREAISNSIDVECKNINIEISRNSKGIFYFTVENDGCGMDKDNLRIIFCVLHQREALSHYLQILNNYVKNM